MEFNKTTPGNNTQLYTNLYSDYPYYYARPFQAEKDFVAKITQDGEEYINVVATSVPDGVSPIAARALISSDTIRRLYIYSEKALSEEYLQSLDRYYGKTQYDIVYVGQTVANIGLDRVPQENHFRCSETPSVIGQYTEYRYLHDRHIRSRIVYNDQTGDIHRLTLPNQPLLILIMPSNFVRTGTNAGYFRFENNLIFRIHSRCMLTGVLIDNADEACLGSVIHTNDRPLMSVIEAFFGKLNLHKIVSPAEDQIFAYDKYLTCYVGSMGSISLPR